MDRTKITIALHDMKSENADKPIKACYEMENHQISGSTLRRSARNISNSGSGEGDGIPVRGEQKGNVEARGTSTK